MDDFGVLVEGIGGFKSPRNSTPLAELKHKPKSQATNSNAQSSPFHSDDLLDTVFRSPPPPQPQSFRFFRLEGDDVFGGTGSPSTSHKYDLESVFTSNNLKHGNSAPFNDDVDDLFGGFVGNSNQKEREERMSPDLDDLIPGFGEPTTKVKKPETIVRPNSSSNLVDDPFLVFESPASQTPHGAWPPHTTPSDSDPSTTQHPKGQSSFDEFDDFIMGANTSGSTVSGGAGFVDEIFGGSSGSQQQKSATRSTPMSEDSIFGDFLSADKSPEVNPNSTSLFTVQKTTFMTKSAGGEFTSLFGEVTTSSGVFQEIEGESEDRRRARLNRHLRTNARMAEALAEKNQRDLESQFEQEEKRRLAQKLNDKLRRWSTGKEGNLRALLSSLQEVLWPECGWRPVSLTDMITSESVKKVYKKATLCVHPDKVQQKGASIEQKYIAEKVFDLLKEAWNKFCREELR